MEMVPEVVPVPATYQIFLNHRGPDVKKTLASLIYHRLTGCGLSVFLDKMELRTGDSLSPAILGAIQSASIHIAIFSETYVESRWCLDELCWILKSSHERGSKIIPVFCDVQPSDLRHIESGRYAKPFEKHELKGRVTKEVIQKWKAALNEASQISGPQFRMKESDHGEFLEEIVEVVLKEVFKWEASEMEKYPVGLEQAVEDFQNEILKESHSNATMIVGIAGMAGVGKSTLARYLYYLRRPDFSRSCFLCDIRTKDLLSLQKKLLRDLLGSFRLPYIDDIYEGKRILRSSLGRLPRIFIVLDDVDHMDQLHSLLHLDAVPSASLIFITSRDKDLLRRSSAKILVYDVKTLPKRHARELFCRHAFPQSKPSEEFEDLVDEFLKICGGLPLSLKVLGGHFVGRFDREYWQLQLERFSTRLPQDLINPLKVSYEALDPEEKEVFLDIGCFLVGEKKDLAVQVLEGLYDNKIGNYLESLCQKCLVDFHYDVQSDDDIECTHRYQMIGDSYSYRSLKIGMHDQLRELAKHIAREEFRVLPMRKPLRLSSSNDIRDMLQSPVVRSNLEIRGIRYSEVENRDNFMKGIRVEGVRLFVVEGLKDVSSIFGSWNMSGELVWLRLRNFSSFHFLRLIDMRKLRVLEIRGPRDSVEQFFGEFEYDLNPWHLNELNICDTQASSSTSSTRTLKDLVIHKVRKRHSLLAGTSISTPAHISIDAAPWGSHIFRYLESRVTAMTTLTKLVLKNLAFLPSLPVDFSRLQNLRHLHLSGCSNLTELPNTFSQLLQLRYLALQDCKNLSIPTNFLGEISTLEYVDFKGCAQLVALPQRIPFQRHLRHLNILRTGLLQLPENLELLDNLDQLTIGSRALTDLPLSLANLRGLTELFLIQCSRLQCILPEGIAALNIKILAIDSCPIGNFSFQDKRNVDDKNIGPRVGMGSLIDITLTNTSISEICIPQGFYPRLETIDLSRNSMLVQVKSLPSTLVKLCLLGCTALKTLTSLSNLVNLKFLNINGCSELEILNVEGLISLEQIDALACWALQRIEGLNERERLKCLYISTANRIIWNDICKYLRWPSHEKASRAIFSGVVDDNKIFDTEKLLRIAQKFNLKILDIGLRPSIETILQIEISLHSYGAILMCFITCNSKACYLDVSFKPSKHRGAVVRSGSIMCGNRGGRSLHVLMWTENSYLWKEYMDYSKINICCSLRKQSVEAGVERGWMMMLDKNTDVSEVCKEFIFAAV